MEYITINMRWKRWRTAASASRENDILWSVFSLSSFSFPSFSSSSALHDFRLVHYYVFHKVDHAQHKCNWLRVFGSFSGVYLWPREKLFFFFKFFRFNQSKLCMHTKTVSEYILISSSIWCWMFKRYKLLSTFIVSNEKLLREYLWA